MREAGPDPRDRGTPVQPPPGRGGVMAGPGLDAGLRALFRGDPEVARDPYPFYRRLREAAAVHRFGSCAVVAGHAEARAVLLDTRRLLNGPPEPARAEAEASLLSEAETRMHDDLLRFEAGCVSRRDGADHARIRAAIQPAFTRPHADALADGIRRIAEALLDEAAGEAAPDMIGLASRLSLRVIASVLGVPEADAAVLARCGNALFAPRRHRGLLQPGPVRAAHKALRAYRLYVGAGVPGRTGTPLRAALQAAAEDGRLSGDECVATDALLLHAGHLTTTNLIGNGLLALLTHREQWRPLREAPARAAEAVEEAFRYDPPVQMSLRNAACDLTCAGIDIPAGTPVWVLIGAANRDPLAFADPDRLDIARRPNPHLGFGHGAHHCLGAALARLQAGIALSTIAQRYPGLALAAAPETLPRPTGLSMRGVLALPVTLRPPPAPRPARTRRAA